MRNTYTRYLLFLCIAFYTTLPIHSQEAASDAPGDPTDTILLEARQDAFAPQERIETLQQKKQELEESIKETTAEKTVQSATPVLALLDQKLDTLQNLDLLLGQQITAYETWISQSEDLKRAQEEAASATDTQEIEPIPFLAFNSLRDKLDAEIKRKDNITSKIEMAQSSLAQAKDTFSKRQTQLEEIRAKVDSIQDATAQIELQYQYDIASQAVDAASETIVLRQIELKNQEREQEVYAAQLQNLTTRVKQVENNIVFSEKELEEQFERLDKEDFSIKRELSKANDAKLTIDRKLTAARERLARDAVTTQPIAEEVNALQYERDAIDTHITVLNENLKWIPIRKTAWQQRFDVFNHRVDEIEQMRWKEEALRNIGLLEQEDKRIQLRLEDRRNQLTTVRNNLDNLSEENQASRKWLQAQEMNIQALTEHWRERQFSIEVTQRLLQKLVNRITDTLARRTLAEMYQTALKYEFYGNSVERWLYSLTIAVFVFFLSYVIRWMAIRRTRKLAAANKFSFSPALLEIFQKIRPWFILILSMFFASQLLFLSSDNQARIKTIVLVSLIVQTAIMVSFFFKTWIMKYLIKRSKRDETSMSALAIFNFITQLIVWSFALILTLSNLGVDVTGLVTGLGIGGVAVALAIQNILGDLFASLSIVLDKPFVHGDFIIFDSFAGSVEHIGIKTTRIRSLTGEQIICANGDLLNARIRNYKRMNERRVVFAIGVTYQTPSEKVKQIPQLIREIVDSCDGARFDRSHFKEYGDFSLNYETVYYVLSSDYAAYMDIQQKINFALYDRFAEENIEFAYPTQTVHLETNTPPTLQ
jgi:MscS family membrane protein